MVRLPILALVIRRVALLLAAASVVIPASACTPRAAHPPSPWYPSPVSRPLPTLRDGRLLFVRYSRGPFRGFPEAALFAGSVGRTRPVQLTPRSGRINALAVSPDGREVAYDADVYDVRPSIHVSGDAVHVMNADGSHNQVVYHCPGSACAGLQWSPVGQRLLVHGGIVLASGAAGHWTCQLGCDDDQAVYGGIWSPDGRRLAFEKPVPVPTRQGVVFASSIAVAETDGSNVKQLTNDSCAAAARNECTEDGSPAWSPTGGTIAFLRSEPSVLGTESYGARPIVFNVIAAVGAHASAASELYACGRACSIGQLQWSARGDRVAFVTAPDPLIFRPRTQWVTSTVGVLDPTSRAVALIKVHRRVSPPDDGSVIPLVGWSPSGRALAMISGRSGRPSALYVVSVHVARLGQPHLAYPNASPPIAWLPAPPVP